MILLINPKTTKSKEIHTQYFREPNLGLLYLAAVLDQHDIHVDILDLEQYSQLENFNLKSLIETKAQPYSIFGLTSLTNTFSLTLKIIEIIKSIKPRAKIILGGPHVSFLHNEILEENKLIDYICIGEAEHSFPLLINLLIKKLEKQITRNNFYQEINQIKGIAYRKNNNDVIFTGSPDTTDLNRLPLPARYKLQQDNYYYRVANVIINRGCPNQCSFCSRQNLFRKPRIRSIKSLLLEIKDIISLQNYDYINFYDNININPHFFKEFCEMFIDNELTIPWGCELRVDSITSEEARLLKEAGCKLVATGIESANVKVLRKNFKFQDPEQVLKGLSYLKKEEIPIQGYFILGLPGETEETVFQTIDYIKKLPLGPDDQINYFIATPYPGSRLWEEREEFNIKIIEKDYSKYDCEHVIFTTNTLSKDTLEHMFQVVKNIENEINTNSILSQD
ncbi:MAG: B12-binding domain-containing radical SAM protein [Promethearchaeota archaeon]|nr:MAG: B12-binding domain-containing radical SAM protein [Candidatus Lokiarchaeota archaeon]